MQIRLARSQDEPAVKHLLQECQLPCEDLAPFHLRHFFASTEGDQVLGVVGLEPRAGAALLRSLAVSATCRGRGLGRELVARAEAHAQGLGIESLYLLTTTAQEFFARLGYEIVDRNSAPKPIQETTEFKSLCPSSSVCMVKHLPALRDPVPCPVEISSDSSRMDVDLIHDFLRSSYWAKGIPRSVVERSLQHSLCFGAFSGGRQVGFARVISDRATFAYLADVFVVPEQRGRGISKALMRTILAHPELQGLRTLLLATHDAHGLYAQFGFKSVEHPERLMALRNPDVYRKTPSP